MTTAHTLQRSMIVGFAALGFLFALASTASAEESSIPDDVVVVSSTVLGSGSFTMTATNVGALALDLDLAAPELGVGLAFGARPHFTNHPDHILARELLTLSHHLVLEDELDQTTAIPQIDKDQAAEVTAPAHPPDELYRVADLFRAEGRAPGSFPRTRHSRLRFHREKLPICLQQLDHSCSHIAEGYRFLLAPAEIADDRDSFGEFLLAEDHCGGGGHLPGPFEAGFERSSGDLGVNRHSGSDQITRQRRRRSCRFVSHRQHRNDSMVEDTVFGALRENVDESVFADGKTHPGNRRPTEIGDQPIVASAADDRRLGPQTAGGDLEDGTHQDRVPVDGSALEHSAADGRIGNVPGHDPSAQVGVFVEPPLDVDLASLRLFGKGHKGQNGKQRAQALGTVLRSIATLVIYTMGLMIALAEVDGSLGPLVAGAGLVGIAIGFGAQTLVQDFLSGIFMLIEDQYGVGDIIDVGGMTATDNNTLWYVTAASAAG